ncbi:MAG TPA: hypothetical protein VF546_01790 [Pyrinomonadaceae bacterium]|jgi:hypothetical protein
MTVERAQVEKIVEQELSGILLQSLKLAEREGKPDIKDALQLILRVIAARREERDRARGGQG